MNERLCGIRISISRMVCARNMFFVVEQIDAFRVEELISLRAHENLDGFSRKQLFSVASYRQFHLSLETKAENQNQDLSRQLEVGCNACRR